MSSDGLYRYNLIREWNDCQPRLGVIALNPSKADGTIDDQTVRKLMGFASRNGLAATCSRTATPGKLLIPRT
jgi:hypothetical protein